mgnify:CR=1 FL=1|tara:strand:+ start:1674 stop:2165 length:492 start_codon:yes stop_codon:yes gene_type:complete
MDQKTDVMLKRKQLMNDIFISVVGIPAAQGSKKHVGRGILIESSKKVAPWRQDVREASMKAFNGNPISEPVKIKVIFKFIRPKGHFGTGKNLEKLKPSAPKYATGHNLGDLDKLLRSTFDGLSVSAGGTVIKDDSLIVQVEAEKRFAMNGEYAGAEIWVSTLS